MKYCNKCFKAVNECTCKQEYSFEIDYLIYPSIYELNRKGYKTIYCCSGHINDNFLGFYVNFANNGYDIDCKEEMFSYETRGLRENHKFIRPKKDVKDIFRRLKNNEKKLMLIKINKELYNWAKNLPINIIDNYIEEKVFSDDYFDDFINMKETIPTTLVLNPVNTEWNYYIDKLHESCSSTKIYAMNKTNTYDHLRYIELRNSPIIDLLTKECNALLFTENAHSRLLQLRMFDNLWNIYSFDGDIRKTVNDEYFDAIDYADGLNKKYYSNHSILECLKSYAKYIFENTNVSLCFFINGALTVAFSKDEFILQEYSYDNSLIITNIKEASYVLGEFSDMTFNENSYCVFIGNQLLERGAI